MTRQIGKWPGMSSNQSVPPSSPFDNVELTLKGKGLVHEDATSSGSSYTT